jgi:MFS family permease
VAGAFLTTNSLALIRGVYGDEAGRAIGLWTAFTSIATIIGPPVGGAIVEWTSWRWIFFVNLPLAALTVVLAELGRCEEKRALRVGRLDLPGAALAAIGFGSLTYGLVEGADRGFADYWWAFALAATAFIGFVVVERRVAEPMLPFALFRRGNLAAANVETFLVYAAIYGFFVYFALHIQALGFSPFETGLALTPPSLVLVALATRFGALADRHGPRLFLTAGPALIGAGCLLTLPIDSRGDFCVAGIAGLATFSLGLAMLVAPITATALKSAPAELAGVASGVNATVSRLGSLTSVALIGLVVSLVFAARTDADAEPLTTGLEGDALAASIAGYRAGMLLAAGLALAGAAVGALAISNSEARAGGPRPEPEPEPDPGPEPAPAGS